MRNGFHGLTIARGGLAPVGQIESMTETTFDSGGDGAGTTPAPWGGRSGTPNVWHPPLSLWRAYVLSVITLGGWLGYWAWQLADDLRRHRNPGIEPWKIGLGMALPLYNALLFRKLAREVEALDAEREEAPLTASLGLFGLAAGLYPIHVAVSMLFLGWSLYSALPAVGLLLLLPLPVLAVQSRLNRFKSGLWVPRWSGTPYRFERGEVVLIVVMAIVILHSSVAAGISPDDWSLKTKLTRWQGESLAAKTAITGESGHYTLTTPGDDWVRVGRNQFHEGSDLSLYGPSDKTTVIVWVECDGESINERVRFRRGEMRRAIGGLTIAERRVLAPDPIVPVSYARYQGTRKGRPRTSLVATAVQGEILVEVIAATSEGPAGVPTIQALIDSFRLKEDAESCDAS